MGNKSKIRAIASLIVIILIFNLFAFLFIAIPNVVASISNENTDLLRLNLMSTVILIFNLVAGLIILNECNE